VSAESTGQTAFQGVACCQARRKGSVWRFEATTEQNGIKPLPNAAGGSLV